MIVDDPSDPRLDDIRDLRSARVRERMLDHVVVEGVLALVRVAAAGHEFRKVVVTEERIDSVAPRLAAAGIDHDEVVVVTRTCLEEVTGVDLHRGVVASIDRPPTRHPARLLTGAARAVVVEGVNDLENIGSLFRTVAALGLGPVLLDPRCADPLYRRCVRVSLGWSAATPFAVAESSTAALQHARDAGLRTVALTPAPGAEPVDRAAALGWLDDPVALVVGAEGPGLDPDTLAAADHRVCVPMANDVDSLNVATALAVVGAFAAAGRSWRA